MNDYFDKNDAWFSRAGMSAQIISTREVLHPSNVRGVVIERVDLVRDDEGHLVEVEHWVQSETGRLIRLTTREITGGAA